MSIKAAIYHLTHYKYDRPVFLQPQIIRLKPAPHSKTKVLSHSLKVFPEKHFVNLQQDPYGNWLSRHVFPEPVMELKIEVDLVADMTVYNPFDFFVEEEAETWPFQYPENLRDDLSIYMRPQPAGPELAKFLASIDRTPRNTVNFVTELNAHVQSRIGYIVRLETGVYEPEETLTKGAGLVPRQRLAAGRGAPPPGIRGAVCVRLSDPAQARSRLTRRTGRHRSRFHRPSRLV